MMSLRSIARTAPRALARISATSMSRFPRMSASILRTQASPVLRTPQIASAFSTSALRARKGGEVDEELSAKLASEIQFEDQVKDDQPEPASVSEFLQNGPWELVDEPGQEWVHLKRTYGNEKITVSFSIADLHNYEPELFDDSAMEDDLDLDQGRSSQDNANEANESLEADLDQASIPCRLNIVIEKAGKGALNIEALAQDGAIVVENLYYYKDAKLAHSASPEAVHAAQDAYPGPPFGNLDEDLQILMERYLEERGISQDLAMFVPDYMDIKEQREYVDWLNNVKKFVDA